VAELEKKRCQIRKIPMLMAQKKDYGQAFDEETLKLVQHKRSLSSTRKNSFFNKKQSLKSSQQSQSPIRDEMLPFTFELEKAIISQVDEYLDEMIIRLSDKSVEISLV